MKFQKEFADMKENVGAGYDRTVVILPIDKNRKFEVGFKGGTGQGVVTFAKHVKVSVVNGRKTATTSNLLPLDVKFLVDWINK